MRWISIGVASVGILALGFSSKIKQVNSPSSIESNVVQAVYSPIAVLELFTSEGCSSCPPADKLLEKLSKGNSAVVPLSFHVDYWNRLGWTDPFSSPAYTARQRMYAQQLNLESVYTPQLVVNGSAEFVGSDKSTAESVIKRATAHNASVKITIDNVSHSAQKLVFSTNSFGEFEGTNLIAALVQKNSTTNVKAGENKGEKLSHINIVRALKILEATNKNNFELTIPGDLKNHEWKLIVFAQEKKSLKILGAVQYEPEN